MHIETSEKILKVYHHHPFPFFIRALKIAIISLPFFLVASFFLGTLTTGQMAGIYTTIAAIFALIIIYDWIVYFLDRLVVTNRRIVHINWRSLFLRQETEAELADIQDIDTQEKGILSAIKLFDYGLFRLETAGRNISIEFKNANNPEGIKHFIYHLLTKTTTMGARAHSSLETPAHDSTPIATSEETSPRIGENP